MIKIPRDFYRQKKFQYIKVDDITIIDYKIYSSNQKIYAYTNNNLIIFIIKGNKVVKFSNGEVKVGVGEILFVNKGNYVMNQIIQISRS